MRVSELLVALLFAKGCSLAVGTGDLEIQRLDGEACEQDAECVGSCNRGACCGAESSCETLALSWWKAFEAGAHPAGLSVNEEGSVAMVGSFTGELSLGGEVHVAAGRDAFVGVFGRDGEAQWSMRYGGAADDKLVGVAPIDDEWVVAGLVGGAVSFPLCGLPDATLGAADAQRLLTARLRDGGCGDFAVEAGQSGGLDVAGVAVVGEGIFVAGSFNGMLADGLPPSIDGFDSFVAELAAFSGSQQGVVPLTGTGNQRITVSGSRGLDIVLAGETDDELRISGLPTLRATGGNDVFVVRVGPGRAPTWGALIGGEGDQTASSVAVAEDAVYVAGCFTGGLELEDSHGAQGTDAYVAKFESGTITASLVLTSEESVGCPQLALDDDGHLLLAANFTDNVAADEHSISSTGQALWLAVLDETLHVVTDLVVASTGAVAVTAIASRDGYIALAADIAGDLTLDGETLTANAPAMALLTIER